MISLKAKPINAKSSKARLNFVRLQTGLILFPPKEVFVFNFFDYARSFERCAGIGPLIYYVNQKHTRFWLSNWIYLGRHLNHILDILII